MRIDCHMHTPLCGHAIGEPVEYVREAAKRALDLITFTCHIPMENIGFGGRNIRMRYEDLNTYFEMVDEARVVGEEFGVRVLIGIEAEVFPSYQIMKDMQTIIDDHPFHFVLGSLHHHTPIFQDWLERHKLDSDFKKIDAYFRLLADAVHTHRYDSMAHPDVIRIYGTVTHFDPEDYEEVIRMFLRECVHEDTCLEVNTSGLSKGVYKLHPDPLILKWAHEMGCKLTIGSDSHMPGSVAQHFDSVLPLLKDIGFEQLHYFENRKRIAIPIN